jgi:putative membrane protein
VRACARDDAARSTPFYGPMMADPQANAARFEVHATSDSHFSWIRTRLSMERTLMSWVRTATALIGFGFTIVQFFERMKDMSQVPAQHPMAPRFMGLSLIAAGILSLAVSIWQYRKLVRYLLGPPFTPIAGFGADRPEGTPLLAVAIAVLLIGVFAFGAVYLRFV